MAIPEIVNWTNELAKEIYEEFTGKLKRIWPYSAWPAESTLSVSIAKILANKPFDIYSEVPVNKNRMDLLLVNHERQWLIHVELKKIDGTRLHLVCDDLERFTIKPVLSELKTSQQINFDSYEKYGLFFGISSDDCWTAFDWWLFPKNGECGLIGYKDTYAQLKNAKSRLSYSCSRSKEWECIPKSVEELRASCNERKIAICYALFDIKEIFQSSNCHEPN